MKSARILLGDDHPMVLEGLKRLLQEEYDVVGLVEDGRALVEAAQALKPDIIVTDMSMPLLNGLEAARRIKKLVPQSKILFLTMHADPTYAQEALQVGVAGYVLKRSAAAELLQAIQAALMGRTYVTPLLALEEKSGFEALAPRERSRFGHLTSRQREILQLVAEGKSTKEIATLLTISLKTVEFHKMKIKEQLGLRTTAELTKYAMMHGLV
ncbi:MAG: DNA-binding response regulator [Nitrospirae bacterium]|nr:MAG: DNA-binding response regulator [Nitrospirota bacterium]